LELLIRTWNVFHGNAQPPERRAYLEQMVRLASADEPDLLCLQELPTWSARFLAEWSGMQVTSAWARPPMFGPIPITPQLGRAITSLNNGFFRSAFTGQSIAILLAPRARILKTESLALNDPEFREREARALRLPLITRLAWAKERRVVQAVRARFDEETLLVANLHATAYDADQRLADAELLRAAVFADALAEPEDVVVLAGDFNIPAARSATQVDLTTAEWGFSEPLGEGIDQILVRGATVRSVERWPRGRRRVDGRILSDHTPVEARIG
jgi:endonuclease/exonuclease/phosphatase family metal-dependent hydrolase